MNQVWLKDVRAAVSILSKGLIEAICFERQGIGENRLVLQTQSKKTQPTSILVCSAEVYNWQGLDGLMGEIHQFMEAKIGVKHAVIANWIWIKC